MPVHEEERIEAVAVASKKGKARRHLKAAQRGKHKPESQQDEAGATKTRQRRSRQRHADAAVHPIAPKAEKEEEDDEYVKEMERLAAQNLSEEKLWRATGTRRLDEVREVTLKVQSQNQFFANLGDLLPSLAALTLDGSELKSLRDLGTSLTGLRSLSLANCRLRDLDGLAAFPELRELNVAGNPIEDLDPLFHHEALQVLDATDTAVGGSLMSLEVLGTCRLLYRLELRGTPLAARFPEADYRRLVCHYLTSLRVLDGKHLAGRLDRVPLDEAELVAAAAALEDIETPVASPPPDAAVAPWQEVLGSRRSRRARVVPAALLDVDPSASALTLDGQEPFSGSALAIMRRRDRSLLPEKQQPMSPPKSSPEEASVLSTLDQAREMDREVVKRRGRLSEWQAETQAQTKLETSAPPVQPTPPSSPAKQLPPVTTSRPRTAPNHKSAHIHRPQTASATRVEERPQTSSARVAGDEIARPQVVVASLPAPVMLAEQPSKRPVSRRGSRSARAFEDSDDDAPPAAVGFLETMPRKNDDSDDDDTRVTTRAAIKARAKQTLASSAPHCPTDTTASPGRRRSRASARLGFDLEGSLAALSQWSDAAAHNDDGAVRFHPSHVVLSGGAAPPSNEEASSLRDEGRLGAALALDDETLVDMLRQPPKVVRHLRTREGFRRFFTGISEDRMTRLLTAAFDNEPRADAKRRSEKRMALVADVLVPS